RYCFHCFSLRLILICSYLSSLESLSMPPSFADFSFMLQVVSGRAQRRSSMTTLPRSLKITPTHLQRKAVVYVRQSTPKQVRTNTESQRNQRALVERAVALGWEPSRVVILD